jgi:hypothetical protein
VSVFMCVFLKTQIDRDNICSVLTGVWIALF